MSKKTHLKGNIHVLAENSFETSVCVNTESGTTAEHNKQVTT